MPACCQSGGSRRPKGLYIVWFHELFSHLNTAGSGTVVFVTNLSIDPRHMVSTRMLTGSVRCLRKLVGTLNDLMIGRGAMLIRMKDALYIRGHSMRITTTRTLDLFGLRTPLTLM